MKFLSVLKISISRSFFVFLQDSAALPVFALATCSILSSNAALANTQLNDQKLTSFQQTSHLVASPAQSSETLGYPSFEADLKAIPFDRLPNRRIQSPSPGELESLPSSAYCNLCKDHVIYSKEKNTLTSVDSNGASQTGGCSPPSNSYLYCDLYYGNVYSWYRVYYAFSKDMKIAESTGWRRYAPGLSSAVFYNVVLGAAFGN